MFTSRKVDIILSDKFIETFQSSLIPVLNAIFHTSNTNYDDSSKTLSTEWMEILHDTLGFVLQIISIIKSEIKSNDSSIIENKKQWYHDCLKLL